jgi:hypothetical protein
MAMPSPADFAGCRSANASSRPLGVAGYGGGSGGS